MSDRELPGFPRRTETFGPRLKNDFELALPAAKDQEMRRRTRAEEVAAEESHEDGRPFGELDPVLPLDFGSKLRWPGRVALVPPIVKPTVDKRQFLVGGIDTASEAIGQIA
jgi:hypothetical protein